MGVVTPGPVKPSVPYSTFASVLIKQSNTVPVIVPAVGSPKELRLSLETTAKS